jgi:hypothetical protein
MMQWRHLNHRPKGITVMVILQILGGISMLGLGVQMAAGVSYYGGSVQAILVGIVYTGLGAFYLTVAYGLYSGKGWAWTSTVVVQIIGFPLGLLLGFALGQGIASLGGIPGVIFAIIILSYMFRSTTRAYFGKVRLTA